MADCRPNVITQPVQAEVVVPTLSSKLYGGIVKKEKKKYIAKINECEGANLTLYEVTSNGQEIEIGTSNRDDKWAFKITKTDLPESTQKSIVNDVWPSVELQRGNQLKDYYSEAELEVSYSGLPGLSIAESNPEKTALQPGDTQIKQIEGVPSKTNDAEFEKFPPNLFYPETLQANDYNQDYIRFQVLNYAPRVFSKEGLKRFNRFEVPPDVKATRNLKEILSEIWLPIQGGISDSSIVNWADDQMSAVDQAAAFVSLSSQKSERLLEDTRTTIESIKTLLTDKNVSSGVESYLSSFFARLAVNSGSNFFSRAFGAILNPNLELLFNSPTLRNFSFRFDLTPRNENEAKQVKQIIRVFKQSMSPRIGVEDIFLKTPMIYEVTYINGKDNNTHKSMNRIKTCALRSFNVNYTPMNQFMTYDDPANTMTAYSLDMVFVELEPVFYDDYRKIPMTEIGY